MSTHGEVALARIEVTDAAFESLKEGVLDSMLDFTKRLDLLEANAPEAVRRTPLKASQIPSYPRALRQIGLKPPKRG